MKCLVCKKEFEGECCPRCDFPVIESPNVDELIQQLEGQIKEHRKAFENGIKLDLVIYRWKEEDGSVVLDRKDRLPFGSYAALKGRETWLAQKFARIPDAKSIDLQLVVSSQGTEKEIAVQVNNLLEPALQTVGIDVDAAYHLRLKLKNDAGGSSASSWIEFI